MARSYRIGQVLVRSVCPSVCPLVTTVYFGKTADSIKMMSGIVSLVSSRKDVLDGGPDYCTGRANFVRGSRVTQCNVYPVGDVASQITLRFFCSFSQLFKYIATVSNTKHCCCVL